jgi:uncharacterized protein YegP (UPF0339 family)
MTDLCFAFPAIMKFVIYSDGAGRWRWTYYRRGRRLAESSEGHPTQAHCLEDIAQMREAYLALIQITEAPQKNDRDGQLYAPEFSGVGPTLAR